MLVAACLVIVEHGYKLISTVPAARCSHGAEQLLHHEGQSVLAGKAITAQSAASAAESARSATEAG
jgi:hypothetical protein